MLNTEPEMNIGHLATSAHKETKSLFKPISSNISQTKFLYVTYDTLMSSILPSIEVHYLGYFVP
jgi:hypothetical protein